MSLHDIDWIEGSLLSYRLPAHQAALSEGGAEFLTRAFRRMGVFGEDNAISKITRLEECPGGSTGRKSFLSVEYAKSDPSLHQDLFVKFSRDFDDPIRDRAKIQMESEVRFAILSNDPNFPINVPKTYFADYELETGTGILITQCIPFGEGSHEPHHEKCLDYLLDDQLEHYQALIRALAVLAGSDKAGRLAGDAAKELPFEPEKLSVAQKAPYTAEQLQRRVNRLMEFARDYLQLLPENLTSTAFLQTLRDEVAQFPSRQTAMTAYTMSDARLIALCHWNANIDNAWFWRDEAGALQCGLMDWGNVSQMNVAVAIWGCLAAAEPDLLDQHLDALLALFISEYRQAGGPELSVEELRQQLAVQIIIMGTAWLLDAPAYLQKLMPDLAARESRFDQAFVENEMARNQLHLLTVFLTLWRQLDFGAILKIFVPN